MTPSHVEVLEEFIETMDRLVDDFYRYQDGDARTPFSVIRDSIVSALTEYQDVRAAIALMRGQSESGRNVIYWENQNARHMVMPDSERHRFSKPEDWRPLVYGDVP